MAGRALERFGRLDVAVAFVTATALVVDGGSTLGL